MMECEDATSFEYRLRVLKDAAPHRLEVGMMGEAAASDEVSRIIASSSQEIVCVSFGVLKP